MVYRFGDFTLDCDGRQLLAAAGEIHLSPKAFDLLALLIANRSRAVSKVELQEKIWPATFVQETSVAGLVNEIRRALDDPPAHPRFVRTVHRFGYRFVGALAIVEERPAPSTGARLYLVVDRRSMLLMEGVNVIGRASDATIAIDSPGVSRYHARILVSNAGATIEDLGSKNGTHVNGDRISAPVALDDGHEIRLGAVVATFRVISPTSATETLSFDT